MADCILAGPGTDVAFIPEFASVGIPTYQAQVCSVFMEPTHRGYTDDLAFIHDVGFGDFARCSAPGLLHMLRDYGIDHGLVVDLGCGSGLWARALTEAGYHAYGIDCSPGMVTLARQQAPAAHFEQASLFQARLPACAAITALGECVNYLFDPRNTAAALERLLSRCHRALRAGGLLIFDVLQPGQGCAGEPRRLYREGDGWATLVEVAEDSGAAVLTRRITWFRRVGKLYRRGEEVHRLRLYRADAVAAALRNVGFRVRRLAGYGGMRFRKGHTGFLARKP